MRAVFLWVLAIVSIVLALLGSLAYAGPITGSSFGSPGTGTCGGNLTGSQQCVLYDGFDPGPFDPRPPSATWDVNVYGEPHPSSGPVVQCNALQNVWIANGELVILEAKQTTNCLSATSLSPSAVQAAWSSGGISLHSQTLLPPVGGSITLTMRANLPVIAGNWITWWSIGYPCQNGRYWGAPNITWPSFTPGLDITSPLPLGGSTICGWPAPPSSEVDYAQLTPSGLGMQFDTVSSSCPGGYAACPTSRTSANVALGWHTYQVVWTGLPSPSMTFAIDSTTYLTATGVSGGVPTTPMSMMLDLDMSNVFGYACSVPANCLISPRIMTDPGGRVTIATGSTQFAYSQSQSFTTGDQLIFNSQPGVFYPIASGSGQFWTLAVPYTGPGSGLNGTAAIHQSALPGTFTLTNGSTSVATSANVTSGTCPATTNTTCAGDTISFGPQPGNTYTIVTQTTSSLTLDHAWTGTSVSGAYGDDIALNEVDWIRVTSP
jgi:hypothetical protein